ncbi:MAG: hypothetical protein GXP38_11935 [Chloroflexi bacterium]|nr:hypothetical protein [Chloroflexota bacterium]
MMQKRRTPTHPALGTFLTSGLGVLMLISLWLIPHQWSRVVLAQGLDDKVEQTDMLTKDSIFAHSSLAIDSQGFPHISFVETSPFLWRDKRLRYAVELEPGIWRFEGVTGWFTRIGDNTSLVVDDAGNPHIAFTQNARLMYARKIDETWQIEAIEGACGESLVLLLDSTGQPHIASKGIGDLYYAHRTEQGWQSSVIPKAGSDNSFVTLALDKNNRPYMGIMREFVDPAEAYHGTLYYVYLHDDVWYTEEVDFGGGGWFPVLVLDDMDRPHFSFQSGSYGEYGNSFQLSYAQRTTAAPTPGEWQIKVVDEYGAGRSMLLLDEDGQPHISYSAGGRMSYATKKEDGWQKMEVDYRFGKCISETNWSIDSIGRPVLACVNEGMELVTWSPMRKYLFWLPMVHRQEA